MATSINAAAIAAQLMPKIEASVPGSVLQIPVVPAAPVLVPEPSQTAPTTTPTTVLPEVPASTVAAPVADLEQPFELDLEQDPTATPLPEAPAVEARPQDQQPVNEVAKLCQQLNVPEQVGQKILDWFRQEPSSRAIVADARVIRELAKTPEEGGIGFKPSMDDVRQFHDSHVTQRLLENYFEAGDADGIQRYTGFFFGPNERGELRPGALQVAEALPYVLSQISPQAFSAMQKSMEKPVGNHLATKLVRMADTVTDPEERTRLLDAAQLVKLQFGEAEPGAAPVSEDSETARLRREVEQLRRERDGNQEQARRQATNQNLKIVSQDFESAIQGDVTRALAPVKDVLHPTTYKALVAQFVNDAKSFVKSNQAGLKGLDMEVQRSIKNGNLEGNRKILVRGYRTLYKSFLEGHQRDYIQAAGAGAKREAATQAAQLQESSNRVAPSASGQRPASAGPAGEPPARLPGESTQQYMGRVFKARVANAGLP